MAASSPLRRLRTAVIGLGRIGFIYHGPAILEHPGFELVGVAEPLADRRAEAEVGWRVPAFADAASMLQATRPELVVIASPTPFHREHAAAAFAVGADVFCDKPVAATLGEVDDMIAGARRHGRRLVAYQPYRFFPEVQALKTLLAEGVLGRLHLVRRARCNFERRKDWQAFRSNGGGMLNNYGAHCLDELLAVLGSDVSIAGVYCQMRCAVTLGDAEDVVKATLTSTEGLLIDLEISQACALPGPQWEVFGEYGAARWEQAERQWRVRRFDPAAVPAPAAQTGFAATDRRYETESFPWKEYTIACPERAFDYYDAVWRFLADGAAPPVTLEESRKLAELMDRCRRSAEAGLVA